jgi:alpha-1,6-mannosyltransferase
MHVVDTTLFYSPTSGGVKRYLLAKHAWLTANTHWRHSILVPGEVSALAPGDVSTIVGGPVPGAFNYRLPLNPFAWARALDALEPDLIEVGDAFHPAWAGWRIAEKRGIPLVAFYHSNFPELAGRRLGSAVQRFIEWYVKFTYERCAQVFAPSRYMVDYLRGIGIKHATFQPLGVDLESFHPARRGRDLRRELNLAADTRLLAFAGRFSNEKNIPLLLESFGKLGSPYHLLLIGGDESSRVDNVTRVPYCREPRQLAQYLASVDAFVHAGAHETFGLVALEAMACGRPVVATRAGALPELIPANAGVLAEPHSPADLAAAIASLYERDLDALGAAARAHVEANYHWGRARRQLVMRYCHLVGAGLPSLGTQELERARIR